MSIQNVVQGETYAYWQVNYDLTGATVTVRARRTDQETVVNLTTSVFDATEGVLRANVSELVRGVYDVQTKVTVAGVDLFFPSSDTFEVLVVNEQLTPA